MGGESRRGKRRSCGLFFIKSKNNKKKVIKKIIKKATI